MENQFVQRARERARVKRDALLQDAARLRALGAVALRDELAARDSGNLYDLAIALNVPHRYENSALKPRSAVETAVYNHLRAV